MAPGLILAWETRYSSEPEQTNVSQSWTCLPAASESPGHPLSPHHDFLGVGPGYLQFDTLLKWLQALQVSDHCIDPFPLHEPICLSEAAGAGPRSPISPLVSFSVKLRYAGQYHFPALWAACNTCYSDFTCSGCLLQWQKQERSPSGRGPEYHRTACHFANSMPGGQKETH